MTLPLFAAFGQTIFKLLLGAVAIFLILLVLVQRGRGGGLAGALGGMGGSSAFGAKAGDVFTRITIVAATIWILLCIAAVKFAPSSESRIQTNTSPAAATTTVETPALSSAQEKEQTDSAADGSEAETATQENTTDSGEAGDADAGDSDSPQ